MSPNPSPAVASPAATPTRVARRWIDSVIWFPFGLILALLVVLAFAPAFVGGGFTAGVVAALAAGALVGGIRCLPGKLWPRLAVGYGVIACALYYLAHDDAAIRPPPRIEALASDSPGAKESYAVLMRYGKQQSLAREFRFQPSAQLQQGQGKWKPSEPGWAAWLTANRAELESGWAKLEPLRAWWAELNSFDRIGDLTPPRSDADILAFQPVRALWQHACAMASLHALDGDEKAAIETLLPILEVSVKLQPASRTLVRSMIAIAAQKMAIETAAFIVDTTALSAGARDRLAGVLAGGMAAEQSLLRIVSIEYEWVSQFINTPDVCPFLFFTEVPRWAVPCLRPISSLALNPQRTLNLYGDLTLELRRRAVRRDAGDIDVEVAKFIEASRDPFKNMAGPLLLTMITPAYKKILDSHWKTEDLRTALQARLQS